MSEEWHWETALTEPEGSGSGPGDAGRNVTPRAKKDESREPQDPSGANSDRSYEERLFALRDAASSSRKRESCSKPGPNARRDVKASLARPTSLGRTDSEVESAGGKGLGSCVASRTVEAQNKGNKESCPKAEPSARQAVKAPLARHISGGLIDVGFASAGAQKLGSCVALKTFDAQDKRLFAPCSPAKRSGFAVAVGGVVVRRKQDPGAADIQESNEEPPLPRETHVVPAADETVRLTLKPWLRNCWQIQGEITTITTETDETTVAEALKDVLSNGKIALAAASHLCTKQREGEILGDLFDPIERQRATDFATTLGAELEQSKLDEEVDEATVYFVRSLEAVVTVLSELAKLTKRQEVAPVAHAGLTEIVLGQVEVDVESLSRAAVLLNDSHVRKHLGMTEVKKDQRERSLSSLRTFAANLHGHCKDMEASHAKVQKEIKERTKKVVMPSFGPGDQRTKIYSKQANLAAIAATGLRSLLYGRVWVDPFDLEGHIVDVCYGDETCTLAYYCGVAWSSWSKTRFTGTQGALHLAANIQDIISSCRRVPVAVGLKFPKVYQVHPMLNSVTTYPSCALKPFVRGPSVDECCGRIRRTALKDGHGMVLILAGELLVILNFKTSNACLIAVNDQMLEGASTSTGSVSSVDKLLKSAKVEGELQMDRYQAEEQMKAARAVNSAQAREPEEMDEWEGTAKVAAATWLRSTYLVLVGNRWYIRQNPRWKWLWSKIVRFVRNHRITGISVLSAGVAWDTVIIRDRKIVQILYEKLLTPSKAKEKSWYEVAGSSDIERIVRATAGSIHLSDDVFRLCRSTIEGSIAQAEGIMLSVLGRFSSWHYLYAAGQQSETERVGDERLLHFDYIAEDPHQVGGRTLLLLDAQDGHYVRLRNDVISHEQRWFKVMNAPDAPVLDLDGRFFKDDASLTPEERKMVRLFDAANGVVSIGAASLQDT